MATPGGGGQPEEDLTRTPDVAEMTERDLAEQGDRRGDGQGRADLGRRQSDDVGEVQRGRRHERAVAHRVDQRGDGENPQRGVEGNPSPGQPVGLVDGRHSRQYISTSR